MPAILPSVTLSAARTRQLRPATVRSVSGFSPGVLDQDEGKEAHQESAGSSDVGDLDSNVSESSDGAVDHPSEIETDDE